MTEHKSLVAALCAAHADMKHAVLDKTNPHFKSKYASLASVMDATNVFSKHGIIVKQRRVQKEDGGWVLRTWLEHVSGEKDDIADEQSLDDGTAQQRGSSLTYARRYGLSTVAGIASEEDDDGNAASGPKPKSAYQGRKEGFYPIAQQAIRDCQTLTELKDWWSKNNNQIMALPPQWIPLLEEEKDRRKLELVDELEPATTNQLKQALKKSLAIELTKEEAEELESVGVDLTTEDPKAFLDDLDSTMAGAADEVTIMEVWSEYAGIKDILPPAAQKQAETILEKHMRRAKADAAASHAQKMREGKKP